jgi:two-component system sensor histidine kinase/response regulator
MRIEGRATILIVDDSEQNRIPLRDMLVEEGYAIHEATDGFAAVAAFQAHAPDLILMDARMPGLDGFAAAAQIRELPGGPDTPILFVTAQRDLETFDAAQRAGANDFLSKPVNLTELVTRVRTALKLRQMSVELRDTYERHKRQRDELVRLQLQKERLTAFVVHDLKNPVSAIDLNAQTLLRDGTLSDSAREAAQHIRGSVRAMMRLILNLLDISRSEAGELRPRKVEVPSEELVRDVIEGLGSRAAAYGVELVPDIGAPALRAERDLLRRVIENLVENAVRHTPRGTAVRICMTRADGGVEVRVADSGPGVPLELRDKIFDKYVQLADGERHASSTNRGLGLTFCKAVVEAHGGTLTLEDATPGAVFCARFPDE